MKISFYCFSGKKSYERHLKEDRTKGYDPRPESMRGDDDIKEDIKNFLLRAHANKKTDKKTGKIIHSNFYCLYANMEIDEGEENETSEEFHEGIW